MYITVIGWANVVAWGFALTLVRVRGIGAGPAWGDEGSDPIARKTLYLANPYGFSAQQREGPLPALEAMSAEVWEPFARNNQIDRTTPGWAYRIGQADLRDVLDADGLFAVVNGCPPGRRRDGGIGYGGRLGQDRVPAP